MKVRDYPDSAHQVVWRAVVAVRGAVDYYELKRTPGVKKALHEAHLSLSKVLDALVASRFLLRDGSRGQARFWWGHSCLVPPTEERPQCGGAMPFASSLKRVAVTVVETLTDRPPPLREGSMDFKKWPSVMNGHRHWPDGRVEPV